MITVPFPPPDFRIKKVGEKRFIYDAIRKKWLLLTDEEWVRQNFVSYLLKTLNYPPAMIALEKEIYVNTLKKRFDILVYNKTHQPWIIVECKAPQVLLDENALQQVLRYTIQVPASWIILTNGDNTIAWKRVEQGLMMVNALPEWELD